MKKKDFKIIFLLESISQPRCIKRIKSFINEGYDVEIYGIDRNKYNVNSCIESHEINVFGKSDDGKNYLKKLLKRMSFLNKLIKDKQNENVVFYSFGFLMTISIWLLRCENYVYEISDISYGYKKFEKILKLFLFLDKKIINKSRLTVMTSKGFLRYYFPNDAPNNIIVQPNKLDSQIKENKSYPAKSIDANNIVFSYVGAFRSENTILRFSKLIGEKFKNHEFHYYGDSKLTEDVVKIADKYKNVKYFGSFKNPEDLNEIYSKIDIVVACYDVKDLNERILEPNKLYEALYFKKPMIVSSNTYLEKKVKELNCGISINATIDNNIINSINMMTQDKLDEMVGSIKMIDEDLPIDDNSESLINYIENNYHK